jgi:hypothetical protein
MDGEECHINVILRRLEKLERQNRWMKWIGAAAIVI